MSTKLRELLDSPKPLVVHDHFYSSLKRIVDDHGNYAINEIAFEVAQPVCTSLNNGDALRAVLLIAKSRFGCGCYESSHRCNKCDEAEVLINELLETLP